MTHPLSREFARITSQSIGLLDSLRGLNLDIDIQKYPPYNISQKDNKYFIEIAVAGFRKEELSVSLDQDKLVVTGTQRRGESSDDPVLVHQGISTREFERIFKLADHIEVTDVSYLDGILKISLVRNEPEPDIKNFDIK